MHFVRLGTFGGRGRCRCNARLSDQYGEEVKVRRDAMGNTTTKYGDGSSVSTRRDAMGNTVVRDEKGNTLRCRVDAMGKTRCR